MADETMTIPALAEKIMDGYRISRDDLEGLKDLFLHCDLDELLDEAGKLQKRFCGNLVDLCSIINGRSGRCSEDCKYCAQAKCNHTGVDEYGFLPKEKIFAAAEANEKAGVNRFAIVTAGRALKGKEFDQAIEAYKEMHAKLHIDLCASMGFLDAEQFHRLHEAGVTSYHHNIETSRRNFPNICTTHTFDDKIRTIKLAQKEGLCVCSGGIIGMGENWDDRFDMAITLAELGIESIPINALMPIPGTPLEHMPRISAEDVMRTFGIFRFINPTANIRMAAGRAILPKTGATVLGRGASASITGDMLTTAGAATIAKDKQMLRDLGLTNRREEAVFPKVLVEEYEASLR
jgi:biotin synthase